MDETLIEKYHRKFKVMAKMIHELQADNLKLRYNLLKWKASAILKEGYYLTDNFGCDAQCERIAEALYERARKIKEEM